ncbi:uncharacterized protein LOC144701104 isoform X2 [Wolffia australiana]
MQWPAGWEEFAWRRQNPWRAWGGAAALCLFFLVAMPKVPHSRTHHQFADMRNLLGVPNTLNVISSFPLLIVGVVGFVLCLHRSCFGISVKGEIWGWAFFFAGVVGLAFGTPYYHLKPDDSRCICETFPVLICTVSLFSILIVERVDGRLGLACLFSLILLVLGSIAYERKYDDLRLRMTLTFVPSLSIPVLAFMFPAKYSHSRYWFLAAGCHLLARLAASADMKIYSSTGYIISGHSLAHIIFACVPGLLFLMLWFRNIKNQRDL